MAAANDDDLIKISRGQLKMLFELISLHIDEKINQIPVADSLDVATEGLREGEVKVLKTWVIKKIV